MRDLFRDAARLFWRTKRLSISLLAAFAVETAMLVQAAIWHWNQLALGYRSLEFYYNHLNDILLSRRALQGFTLLCVLYCRFRQGQFVVQRESMIPV